MIAAVLAVSACAQRGEIRLDPAAAKVGAVQDILVASLREPDPSGPGFGEGADSGLSFAAFQVSVPPDRLAGTVTFSPANGAPDPATEFLTVGTSRIASRTRQLFCEG